MIEYISNANELYKNNPLIECLPTVLEDVEVIEKLCNYPLYSQSDRQMSKENKLLRIKQLHNFYQALNINVEIYCK